MDRVEAKVFAQDEVVQQLSMRCCLLEDKLQQWFKDRHGLETESETKADLVQTKRRKGRRKRNEAAVGNDIACQQQVLVDSVDDECGAPGNIDVAKDHTMVGCASAVLEPGEQDRTRHAATPDDGWRALELN